MGAVWVPGQSSVTDGCPRGLTLAVSLTSQTCGKAGSWGTNTGKEPGGPGLRARGGPWPVLPKAPLAPSL